MRTLLVCLIAAGSVGLHGCGYLARGLESTGVSYRIPIQQGNVLTQERVNQLQPGMAKLQVRHLMGTPMLVDPFHQDRWDYVYTFRPPRGDTEERRASRYFENDNLVVPGMPYGTCQNLYCHGTGTPALTGGANQNASPNIPKWGLDNSSLCGSCHGAPGGPANYSGKAPSYPTSGAHAMHFHNARGPQLPATAAGCGNCHRASTDNTHGDGTVDFKTAFNDNTAADLAATRICDQCHGRWWFR